MAFAKTLRPWVSQVPALRCDSMPNAADVDSRHYAIAYELRSNDDTPPDFRGRDGPSDFDTAVFLPRDDPDWFGRSSYPPRLLALAADRLSILPHPSARERAESFSLRDLCFVESGHILLRGWLRFAGRDFDRTLPYNTRDRTPVQAFMRRLRASFLNAGANSNHEASIDLGDPLDLKFRYALSRELDTGEIVRAFLFRPAREFLEKVWILKRQRRIAADLVALTSRRLLWITDRHSGYARYGSIARYAALGSVARVERVRDGNVRTLKVTFHSLKQRWDIPLAEAHYESATWFERIS
jgi:hypothetical protein